MRRVWNGFKSVDVFDLRSCELVCFLCLVEAELLQVGCGRYAGKHAADH